MEEFDISHLDDYTIEQLANFVIAGKTTVQELYEGGLYLYHRPKLLRELEAQDNIAWKKAVADGTIDAIDGYLAAFNQLSPHYHGSHIEEAKELKIKLSQVIETEDTDSERTEDELIESQNTGFDAISNASEDSIVDTHNRDSDDSTGTGFVPFETVSDDSEIPETKGTQKSGNKERVPIEIENRPTKTKISIKPTKKWIIFGSIAIIAITGLLVIPQFLNKKEEAVPLTQNEIHGIIKNYQDSLKTEIFDGFYLIPSVWDGISRNYPIPLPGEDGFNENLLNPSLPVNDSIHANTQQDVIALFKGRLDVVNKDGLTMPLPGVSNGIDSLILVNKPFIEYFDDNGLRRVVALLNNDVYYYAGFCGTHDGFRQYVLINRVGKYGLIDENCTIIEDFFNEKITIADNGYYVKNGSVNQLHDFDGDAIQPSTEASSSNSNPTKSLPVLSNFYDKARGLYGYKDENGKIVIPAKFKNCPWRFSEITTSVVLADKKSAFIDRKGKILATFKNIDNYYTSTGNVKVKGFNDKYGIYNRNKHTLTLPTVYDDVNIYGDNLNMFPVKKNGKWGYVKAGGEVVIPLNYKDAYTFNKDTKWAAVKDENGKCGYIDMSGSYKIQPQYYSVGTMTPEGARVMRSSNEYGYITKSGNLIASWYPYMSNRFVLDRIFVRNKDKLGGFVDKNNKLVIPYQFEETEPVFSEVTHLAKVRFKGMDWYINTNGAFSIPECIYVDAIDKKHSRDWDDRTKRKDTARKKVPKDVTPTEQSIPELMLRIAEISEQVSQEIANEEINNDFKGKRTK